MAPLLGTVGIFPFILLISGSSRCLLSAVDGRWSLRAIARTNVESAACRTWAYGDKRGTVPHGAGDFDVAMKCFCFSFLQE